MGLLLLCGHVEKAIRKSALYSLSMVSYHYIYIYIYIYIAEVFGILCYAQITLLATNRNEHLGTWTLCK